MPGADPRASGVAGPVLVTGGTGFIGARLTAALKSRGADVRTFGRYAASADVVGDLNDPASVERAVRGARTIFHLASLVHDRRPAAAPGHAVVGREGTAVLLDAASRAGAESVIFVSSLAVYGASFSGPAREDEACAPDTPYGRAKLEAEALVRAWGRRGRRSACLRPAMTYGRGCKGNLPRLVRAIRRGVCPPIPVTAARRSMVHVESVVDVLLLAAAAATAEGRVFNVADEETLSTGEIYERLMRAAGRQPPRWRVPVPVFRAAGWAGDLIERATGSSPFTSRGFETLFGPAVASTARLTAELGYRSPRSFSTSVTELIQ